MKRKILIVTLALILSIISTVNISIGIYARKHIIYEASLTSTQIINNIVINNTVMSLEKYINEDVKFGQKEEKGNSIKFLYSESSGKIKIVASIIDNVYINYDGDIENIQVYKDGKLQDVEGSAFIDDSSILSIIYDSLNYYSIIFLIISFGIILGLVFYIFKFIEKIKDNNVKISDVIFFICSIFIIFLSTFYIVLSLIREVIIVPIILVATILIYCIRGTLKDKIENCYLVLATIFGIAMLFLIPPFNVPDEGAHFIKSFETSYINNNDGGYTHMPKSIELIFDRYIQGSQDSSTKYNGKNYLSDFLQEGNYDERSERLQSYANTKFLSVVPYIPSIITIAIGRLINLSPLLLVIIGRFTNLLITIVFCYLSLNKIPYFKRILFIVVMLPIFIQQAAAINMDWLTNLMSVIIITLIFYYKENSNEINIKSRILILISAILLAFCKFGYFPISFMVLLIPNNRFKNKKQAVIFKVLFILLPSILSYLQNSGLGLSDDSPYYKISYALEHPISTIKIYFATAFERIPLDIFRGLFDGFGVSTQWHSSIVLYILIVLYAILIATAGNDDNKMINWKERTIMLVLSFIMICIIYSAMLFGWTYFGALTIDGLQPRYFIPPVLLAYIALSNNIINLNVKNKNIVYSSCLITVYLLCFLTISLGFY